MLWSVIFQGHFIHQLVIAVAQEIFKGASVSLRSGGDNRIAQDHAVGLQHLRRRMQHFCQEGFFLPENTVGGCQMAACRCALNHHPVRINVELLRMLS